MRIIEVRIIEEALYTDTGTFFSNSLSSPRFNLLHRCLLLLTTFSSSSYSYLVLLLALSFSRLILSLSLLCSSVALFALSFSFLSNLVVFGFFFDHAKA